MKMRQFKIFILIIVSIIFSSCRTLKEGFQNNKKNSNEEFLVEKKMPLVVPPDFNELPIPQEENEENENNENEIKKLILKNKDGKIKNSISKTNETFKKSFLKKIQEN